MLTPTTLDLKIIGVCKELQVQYLSQFPHSLVKKKFTNPEECNSLRTT